MDTLDSGTLAISGEVQGRNYVIQYRTLQGATLQTINIGVSQVRWGRHLLSSRSSIGLETNRGSEPQ